MSRSGAAYMPVGEGIPLVMAPTYYYDWPRGVNVSTGTLTNNRLRLVPLLLGKGQVLDRMGAEVTIIGDVGSTYRCVLYRDNGANYPSALLLDAGAIATDAVAIAEIVVNQALPAGAYWIGGVVQGAPVTQPTMRTVSTLINATRGLTAPAGGGTSGGYFTDAVAGAPPDPFPAGAVVHGTLAQALLRASS